MKIYIAVRLGQLATSLLLFSFVGCKHVPLALLTQSASPDGKFIAALTVDTNTRVNGSDIYRVNLRPIRAEDPPDVVVLEPNDASGLALQWAGPKTLLIRCSQCEIASAAVHFYRVEADGIDISFSDIQSTLEKRENRPAPHP